MDARDTLHDGWPVIADRDMLPLVWLLEGAALTASFVKRESDVPAYRDQYQNRLALRQERDAVDYAMTLPSWWHCCPVRAFRCCDKPKPPPKPTKPLYIWLRRG